MRPVAAIHAVVPTARFVPLLRLGVHEHVTHAGVPAHPSLAFHVVEDLRGVVVEVEVLARSHLGEPVDTALESRVILLPAEIHPAEQADGGGPGAVSGSGVAVGGAVVLLHGVEKLHRLLDRERRYLQECHVATLERHQLPAHGRGVACLLGRISPAAAGRILRGHDVVEGRLCGQLQAAVLRHRVALGEHDARQALRIHVASRGVGLALSLHGHGRKEADSGLDLLLVGAFLVRVATAKEGEQGHRCGTTAIRSNALVHAMCALAIATGTGAEIE